MWISKHLKTARIGSNGALLMIRTGADRSGVDSIRASAAGTGVLLPDRIIFASQFPATRNAKPFSLNPAAQVQISVVRLLFATISTASQFTFLVITAAAPTACG